MSGLEKSANSVPVIGQVTLPQADYEDLLNWQDEFDVVCYQILYKSERYSNEPLTPLYETAEQAREILADIKGTEPTARVVKFTFFYNSENDRDRLELINKIHLA